MLFFFLLGFYTLCLQCYLAVLGVSPFSSTGKGGIVVVFLTYYYLLTNDHYESAIFFLRNEPYGQIWAWGSQGDPSAVCPPFASGLWPGGRPDFAPQFPGRACESAGADGVGYTTGTWGADLGLSLALLVQPVFGVIRDGGRKRKTRGGTWAAESAAVGVRLPRRQTLQVSLWICISRSGAQRPIRRRASFKTQFVGPPLPLPPSENCQCEASLHASSRAGSGSLYITPDFKILFCKHVCTDLSLFQKDGGGGGGFGFPSLTLPQSVFFTLLFLRVWL